MSDVKDFGEGILGIVDAKSVLQTCQEGCKASGLDSGKMIVVGQVLPFPL